MTPWASLCLLIVVAASLWAQTPAVIESLTGQKVEGVVTRMIHGERMIATGMRGHSIAIASGEEEYSIGLERVSAIQWRGTAMNTITSGTDTMCAVIDTTANESLPADWAEEGSTLRWQAIQLPQAFHQWRHIPGAQWVWSDTQWANDDREERVIFRQSFTIPQGAQIVDAMLSLDVDDSLEMGRLNGVNLPLPSAARSSSMGLSIWDVTQAVTPGRNFLGFVASNGPVSRRSGTISPAGLVYRLDVRYIPSTNLPAFHPSALVRLDNGDHVWGHLRRINDSEIVIETGMGQMVIDRDWASEIVLSGPPPASGLVSLRSEPANPEPLIVALPPRTPTWAPGLLLNDGTHLSGRILQTDRDGVTIKPRYSDAATVPLNEVRAVYINEPNSTGEFHYPLANGPRICQALTIHGDRLSGVLTDAGEMLEINAPESEGVRVPASQMVECVFPLTSRLWAWAQLRLTGALDARRLAMWGTLQPDAEGNSVGQRLVVEVNQLAADLGCELDWIDDAGLATSMLTAQTHPVLFIVDEREEFPVTVNAPNDGLDALLSYIESGGVVVVMASGTPFYHGRVWTGQRWDVRPLRQVIPASLGFNYLSPGVHREGARAFEVPNPALGTLSFLRSDDNSPWGVLPAQILFPSLSDSRFRPILSMDDQANVQVEPIYQLVTQSGVPCGTAMAAVRHFEGPMAGHTLYHISPALAHAVDEHGEPVIRRLLPAVLVDAFITTPPSTVLAEEITETSPSQAASTME